MTATATAKLHLPETSLTFFAKPDIDCWVLTCPRISHIATVEWLQKFGCKFQSRISTDRNRAEFFIENPPSRLVRILIARHYPDGGRVPASITQGLLACIEREQA